MTVNECHLRNSWTKGCFRHFWLQDQQQAKLHLVQWFPAKCSHTTWTQFYGIVCFVGESQWCACATQVTSTHKETKGQGANRNAVSITLQIQHLLKNNRKKENTEKEKGGRGNKTVVFTPGLNWKSLFFSKFITIAFMELVLKILYLFSINLSFCCSL
jgi:hypothetical protein